MSNTCPYCPPFTVWGIGPQDDEAMHKWHDAGHPKSHTQGNDMPTDDSTPPQGDLEASCPTPHSKDELRKAILKIDTTFDMGDSTTMAFLPPNFYIDRLVEFIEATSQRARLEEAKYWEQSVIPAVRGEQFEYEVQKRFRQLESALSKKGQK